MEKQYIGLVALLLVVLNASAVEVSSREAFVRRAPAEFQFVAAVPYATTNGESRTTVAYLWIPGHCRQVRGVLLTQQNVVEQTLVEHPAIRKACADAGLAIIWCCPSFAPRFENPEHDGKVLQKVLDELAAVSGYEELSSAPWLPFGHSTTGLFSQRLVNWKPERAIALIDFKSGVEFGLRNNRSVPFLYTGGHYTEWEQYKRNWDESAKHLYGLHTVRKERAATKRALSYIEECGGGHFELGEEMARLIGMYMVKAAAARLPPEVGGPLKDVDVDNGWVVDMDMPKPLRNPAALQKECKEEAKDAPWFFDRELAEEVEKFENVSWTRKNQIPGFTTADGQPSGFKWRGITSPVPYSTGDDGVTLRLGAAMLEKMPENFVGAGQPLGHGKGNVTIEWICGSIISTGNAGFRIALDRSYGCSPTYLLVRHPGDEEYRPSVQPGNFELKANAAGKPQVITFDPVPDQAAGARTVTLHATSDSGMPVEFFVKAGPATVAGNVLTIGEVPPRSRFPVKVTVVAYQWGRSVEPMVKTAPMVERVFAVSWK